MTDLIPREIFNRLHLYVHRTETPESLAGGPSYDKKPQSFYYGELLQRDIPLVMAQSPMLQELTLLPGTRLDGYMVGFPDRLEVGVSNGKATLTEEQVGFVKEQTRRIMKVIYPRTRFPVDHRLSIDDILVVSLLWGENWHIKLHRGMNRLMREIEMEPLY